MRRAGGFAVVGAAVAAATAAAAAALGGRDDAPRTEGAPAAVQAPPVESARPATGRVTTAAKPDAKQVDRSRELELPDGTFVAALNGAVGASPLAVYWGSSPWSPIVGVERNSAGVDWYRHADGSYSTTEMVWRKDLGRKAAMTRVAHPGPAAPVAPAAPAAGTAPR